MPRLAFPSSTALACLVLAGAAAPTAPARAETTGCIVLSSFPASIVASGHYCLTADVAQDFGGHAIGIHADDVVLDCNDHVVRHTAPADTTTFGVNIGDGHHGVTVRNCVLDGFQAGIYSLRSSDPPPARIVIANNRVRRARTWGIYAIGSGYVVEDNLVSDVLGNPAAAAPTGILLQGFDGNATGNVVRGNRVGPIRPQPPTGAVNSSGIQLTGQRNPVVADNIVSGLYANTGQGVYGIITADATGISMERNLVLTPPPLPAPLDGGNYRGIYLQGSASEQLTNVCVDNVLGHWNTNVEGCVIATTTSF